MRFNSLKILISPHVRSARVASCSTTDLQICGLQVAQHQDFSTGHLVKWDELDQTTYYLAWSLFTHIDLLHIEKFRLFVSFTSYDLAYTDIESRHIFFLT
jgi:hypothetical protein